MTRRKRKSLGLADRNAFGHTLIDPRSVTFGSHKAVRRVVGAAMTQAFLACGVETATAAVLVIETFRALASEAPLRASEQTLRQIITDQAGPGARQVGIRLRADILIRTIAPHIKGESVLDIGCGNGLVAAGVAGKTGTHVTMCDVSRYVYPEAAHLAFVQLREAETLPFPDNAFDTGLLIAVLHHTRDPIALLEEARRVVRSRLVILESVFGVSAGRLSRPTRESIEADAISRGFLRLRARSQFLYASVMDWFYNRVLEGEVVLFDNFDTLAGWRGQFERNGDLVDEELLGVDEPSAPEFHVLFVVDLRG